MIEISIMAATARMASMMRAAGASLACAPTAPFSRAYAMSCDALKDVRTMILVAGLPETICRVASAPPITGIIRSMMTTSGRRDAAKYDKRNKLKILKALEIVPEELKRRNKRFIVADLKEGSRYDREEDTFLWLEEAGIGLSIRAVTEPKVPLRLARRSNFFKLFLNDVGLLSALYMDGIQYRMLNGETDVNFGAVYENFVAQELASKGFPLYYFNSEDRRTRWR